MNNKIIYCLLPLSLIFDILTDTVFETGGNFALIKAALYYLLIFYTLIHSFKQKNKITGIFLIFLLYVVIQIPFSNQPLESLRMSLKVLMSIMMLPLGFYFINNFNKFKVLNKSVIAIMVIYILNYAVSQFFGIGLSVYTSKKEFVTGNLTDNWNVITYMLLVVPLILMTEKNKKKVFLLSAILLILLIISLKRIAILGLIIGYIIYILKTGKLMKSLRMIFLFSTIFLISFPIFESVLSKRIEARGSKLSGSAVSIVEKETRFLETLAVYNEVFSFKNPVKSLFGFEAFYSVGNYGRGLFGERQLHIDYNLILNTIGIVGLFIYLSIFYNLFK